MTQAQRARLAELLALTSRTAEQEAELTTLQALAAANPEPATAATAATQTPAPAAAVPAAQPGTAPASPAPGTSPGDAGAPSAVAASIPAVPAGVPAPVGGPAATTTPNAGERLRQLYREVTAALQPGTPNRIAALTAALSDITWSANSDSEAPGWTGELFSGVAYEPLFDGLFNEADLTNWEGNGWRFTDKLEIKDYAGDKAAIPTDTIGIESSSYTAARMAVGVDVDRKFFDFPSTGFVESLFAQVGESWKIKKDAKIAAYIQANAAAVSGVDSQTSLLKAAAYAVRALKRLRVGQASFILVNDDDMMSLFDVTVEQVLAYLELWGIDPKNFRSTDIVPAGQVYAGVKAWNTWRQLPGSPIRVEAQNLNNAGIDEAFFGYWAIEQHHKSGIVKVPFA